LGRFRCRSDPGDHAIPDHGVGILQVRAESIVEPRDEETRVATRDTAVLPPSSAINAGTRSLDARCQAVECLPPFV